LTVVHRQLRHAVTVDDKPLLQMHSLGEGLTGELFVLHFLWQETYVDTCQVVVHVVVLRRVGTVGLYRGVESAQSVELHPHSLREQLNDAIAEFRHHSFHHVAGIDRPVADDVVGQAFRVERGTAHSAWIPFHVRGTLTEIVLTQVILHCDFTVCHLFLFLSSIILV